MNIYQKLIEVKKAVEFLKKEAKGHQFQYNPSSQVIASVREKMNEVGLFLEARIERPVLHLKSELNSKEHFTELHMTMVWINAEKPEERIEIPWYGQGLDTGEKGVGKALTYAEKFFLLKQFNIPTDKDDPDSQQGDEKPKTFNNNQQQGTGNPVSQKQIGMLKARALEFGSLRQKTDKEVYKVLEIDDLTKLSSTQASGFIKQLDEWIQKAKKEQVSA
ncbi:hypothetical protein HMPREF3291_05115 [Bacillus sp. HMSC76G11]|nr:hypothetical protein HMPREF3291_05115 [Bacillus sp. HMSC76G11]